MVKKWIYISGIIFTLAISASAVSISDGGDYSLESDSTCNDGLSGITYAGGTQYYTVDDSGGYMQPMTINIDLSDGSINSVSCSTNTHLGGSDLEGIAYNAANDTVFVSDESGATIKEYSFTIGESNGTYVSSVDVPDIYSSYRGNMSLESLTIRGDGLEMWTCNEQALSNANNNVNDGPVVSSSNGTEVRLQRFTRSSVHDSWTTNEQYVYLSESADENHTGGVSDLCVLPDGTLLVLERWRDGYSLYNRIYEVDYSSATDVSSIQSLEGATYTRVTKTSRWSDSYFGATYNYEGICIGPRLNDGSLSLLLISDGDDTPDKGLHYLAVSGLSTRNLDVESLAKTGVEPYGKFYRYVTGSTLTNTAASPSDNGDYQYVCTGWTLTGGDTPASGTTNTMTMTINNDDTLTWLWGETNLLLDTEVSGSGSVTPADGYYTNNASIVVTPTPSPRYYFVNWTGDVPSGHETDNPLTVTMDQPRHITAIFGEYCGANTSNTIPYAETFESYTNGYPVSGTNGWSSSAFSNAIVNTNSIDIVNLNNYSELCGYPIDNTAHAKVLKVQGTVTNSFNISSNKILWVDNMVQANSLNSVPESLNSNDVHIAFYFNADEHPMIRHYDVSGASNRWTEIPDVTIDNTTWARVTFKMDYQTTDTVHSLHYSQVRVNGNLITNQYAFTTNDGTGIAGGSWFAMPIAPAKLNKLIYMGNGANIDDVVVDTDNPLSRDVVIDSSYGNAEPPAGTNGYTYGDTITISVTNSPIISGTTQYVCTGWIMTGNTPTNGTGTNVTVTITNDLQLTWLWATNYWLDTEAAVHGTVIPNDNWYRYGTNVTITPLPAPRYKFAEWTGDVPSGHEQDNPLSVTMDQPRQITGNFADNCGPNTTNMVIYIESFESYTNGFQLPGTNGWSAGALSNAVVSMDTNIMYQLTNTYNGTFPLNTNHTKVLNITSDTTNMIYGSGYEFLSIDSMVRVNHYYGTPDILTNVQTAFFVDDDGLVNILHADTTDGTNFTNQWLALTNSPVLADKKWARFTLVEDFSNMMFQVRLNGSVPLSDDKGWTSGGSNQPGTWFYMPDRSRYYLSSVIFKNSSYIDDIKVSDNIPTLVVISGFSANTISNEVVVSWDVEMESGTIGYYLERKIGDGWVRINDDIIQANPFGNPPPYHYSVVDNGAESWGTYTWRIIELDNKGNQVSYGPYTVTVDGVAISYDNWAAGIDWQGEDSSRYADADGDGFKNFEEYLAHTDPMDANSLLQITSLNTLDANTVVVSWQSASGAVYSVEYSADIDGNWLPVANDIPATVPVNVKTISVDTATSPQMFFKVIEK